MVSNEEEYGFFEDVDNGDIILSYSNQNLPNYKDTIYNNSIKKKKRDSYDESEEDCLTYTYSDYTRHMRMRIFYCIQYCYPCMVVCSILSLFGWILYAY